jgi:hypothetical protein
MKTRANSKPEIASRFTLPNSSFDLRTCFGFRISIFGFYLALAISASAVQNFSIDWFKIAGGGGTSTNAQYSLSGTIGQHDAGGPFTGGNYSLTGGFWALLAVQTTGAPKLRIVLTTTNTAVVAWPSPSTGWKLQQDLNLSTTSWTTPSESVTDNGTEKFIIVKPPVGNRFYRLTTL